MSDPTSQSIEQKLRQAWRQQQRFHHVRGAARLLIWLVVLIVLDFLIDWGIVFRARLGIHTGFALLTINVVILGWVLWREWLRHLKSFNPVLVSLDVESKNPDLSSLLVSYAQLRADAPNQPDVSTELIEAMRRQAIDRAAPIDFRRIIDFGQLRNLLLVTGAIVLLFAALSINWAEHFQVLMRRLIGSSQAYPTQTKVESVTGDLTIKVGDSAEIIAGVSGIVPQAGRIYTKVAGGDGDWSEAPLTRREGRAVFSRDLAEVNEDILYYVRIGDDQSRTYRISVVSAPQIERVEVALNYPSYMNKPAGGSDQLNLDGVPEGTLVHWTLVTRSPVEQLQVIVIDQSAADRGDENGPPPPPLFAEKDETGKRLSFSLKAAGNFKYAFRWTRRVGDQAFEYADVQHVVRVAPDDVPQVDLLRPSSNGPATDRKTVNLQFKAFDDHGLSKAWLVYSINSSEEKRVLIHDFEGVASGEVTHVWHLNDVIPQLTDDTQIRISFAVEVSDHYPDQLQHLNRSATRQFTIVDQEEYLRWYREELAAQQEAIKRARQAEATASEKVRQLKEQEFAPQ